MELSLKLDLVRLVEVFLDDAGFDKSDVVYATRRVKNEGIGVMTRLLPRLAKAVLRGIDEGEFPKELKQLDASTPDGLSCLAWKGNLPRFGRRFLLAIFDERGCLRENPDPLGLWVLRQGCEYFYKLALDYPEEVLEAETVKFTTVDESVPQAHQVDYSFLEEIRKNVETHYEFPSVSAVLGNYRPRFGPGTYSGFNAGDPAWLKLKRGSTTTVPRWAGAISGYFKSYPSAGGVKSAERVSNGIIRKVTVSGERIRFGADTAPYSELLFVPKDSRGPRTIIREPMQLLRLQMAFFDWFSSFLEDNTNKRVNFQDQSVNRALALEGSVSGKWATIDLKEASDRVSLSIIKSITRHIPVLRWFLSKRSTHVRLPDGSVRRLKKLAGMGSGLTFATMSFLIHAAISTALASKYGSFAQAARHVYVYGDDIIVPTVDARQAMRAIRSVGLLPNEGKSYFKLRSRALFRESCGGDYFCGQDVVPIRLRLSSGKLSLDGNEVLTVSGDGGVLQLERHCRELVDAGLLATAEYYYSRLESKLGPLPRVSKYSAACGRYSRLDTIKYSPNSVGQYIKRPVWVPRPKRKDHSDPNHYAFMAQQLVGREDSLENLLFPDASGPGGTVYTVPRKVSLRKRKVSEYSLMLTEIG